MHSHYTTTASTVCVALDVGKANLTIFQVRVTNQLGQGLNVTLHCKLKYNDLGIHVLQYQQYFEWKFHNICGTTHFHCYLQSQQGNNAFDIYRQGMCNQHCNRFIRTWGTCLETHKPRYKTFRYAWPPSSNSDVKG
ncbi:hypothetical protein TEA_028908 [Camellia sinensis var. sinensis]|uniref:S-protein homolog n=1 Tax=Camellia sinensis var. sinensis TaxID=542762 RepID=A0A4S4DNM5_CAMSN|nr:hypothetical protein TEA_028908 [Camellia sinensis var. sinensis]